METDVNSSAVGTRHIELVQGLRAMKHCLHSEETPALKTDRVLTSP